MSRSQLIMGIVGILWGWYSESTAAGSDRGREISEREAVDLLGQISDFMRASVKPEAS